MSEAIPIYQTENDITSDAVKRVKRLKAHKYASDQYGIDSAVEDDLLERIIQASGLAQTVAADNRLLREALVTGRHATNCNIFSEQITTRTCTCYLREIKQRLGVAAAG